MENGRELNHEAIGGKQELSIKAIEAKTLNAAQEAYRLAKEQNPNLDISHQEIGDLFNLTREFFGASKEVTNYLFEQAKKLSKELSQVEGFVGAFGLGYPFYGITSDGKPFEIPEISNFIDYTRDLVEEDSKRHPDGWVCAACQKINNLPDLKTICKPCDLVTLKPRDVFKGLPDLDMVAVIKNPTKETEEQVQAIVNGLGYHQSDTNIADAMNRTKTTLQDLKDGKQPEQHLPIDIHIWSQQAVEECMQLASQGDPNVEIIGRALHTTWETHPVNFSFDFAFTFSELETTDDDFLNKINETRRTLLNNIGVQGIIKNVEQASKRASRLMESKEVRSTLAERIQKWYN